MLKTKQQQQQQLFILSAPDDELDIYEFFRETIMMQFYSIFLFSQTSHETLFLINK